MRPLIKDEFTHLKLSKQRKYQMRKRRDRKCTQCGEPAVGTFCLKHTIERRETQRKRRGNKRRNKNSMSYKLERQLV